MGARRAKRRETGDHRERPVGNEIATIDFTMPRFILRTEKYKVSMQNTMSYVTEDLNFSLILHLLRGVAIACDHKESCVLLFNLVTLLVVCTLYQ